MKSFFCALFLCAVAGAQDFPESPGHTRFWDTQTKIWFAAQLTAEGLDAWATERNAACPYKYTPHWYHCSSEINPVAAPFVRDDNKGKLILYFGLETGAKLGAVYLAHRTHHHKIERALQWISVGENVYGAGLSFAGSRR